MKKIIKKFARKNYFFRKLQVKRLEKKRRKYFKDNYLKFNVDEKLVIVESYQGRNFSCSPRAIYEYMINNKKYDDYHFVIPLRKVNEEVKECFEDKRTKVVKFRSKEYFDVIAQAKYWISNSIFETTVIKKDNQKYLQTWHGTPLKKLAFDIDTVGNNKIRSNEEVRTMYASDAIRYDMVCSPSPYFSEHITSAFNLKELHNHNIVFETGYPRNDCLINYQETDVIKIKERLNIPNDKKVVVYAPTWRDNQHQLGVGFTLDLKLDLDKLYREFSSEYFFILKLHHFIASKIDLTGYEDFVIDCSKENDINDLHLISDVLITDYSSLFFDYANLKKPILFYMFDYDEYAMETRGFYFDFEYLPGPIFKNEDELIKGLKNLDETFEPYLKKLDSFNEKYNPLEDGKSAQRTIEKFLEI
ncbi:CDP-glycerol glycerophosphotransferase family protein [Erysipelotrichaceae bacterium OttesenSCG-928-M19]|nr:CDP-glycerol glycerophosphotransferase family protein [Erysipelotrichaceae bacterium OttesenSCG-928-M19]